MRITLRLHGGSHRRLLFLAWNFCQPERVGWVDGMEKGWDGSAGAAAVGLGVGIPCASDWGAGRVAGADTACELPLSLPVDCGGYSSGEGRWESGIWAAVNDGWALTVPVSREVQPPVRKDGA